jgi:hypothetical protein
MQLAIYVCETDVVEIDDRHPADPGAANRLGSITPDPSEPENSDTGRCKPRQPFSSDQQFSAGKTV